MTTAQNAADCFRADIAALKVLMHWTDDDLAQRVGCSKMTIVRARKDPFTAKGSLILVVQELLKQKRAVMVNYKDGVAW